MPHSQYDQSEKLLGLIHGIFGIHPTYRSFHAAGAIYRGSFTATPEAKVYTRAIHMQGDRIPVTVRYSLGGGDPSAAPKQTAGMATKFYLADGRVTDLVMLNAPTFPTRNVDELVELIGCFNTETHQLDMAKLQPFLATHPATASALALRKGLPAPVSFAQTAYHAIHAFRFVNADGIGVHAKYHWIPEANVAGQTVEELQALPNEHLFDEMAARIADGPCKFHLELELGEDNDPTDDPTQLWPKERKRVVIGELELVAKTSVEEIGDPIMLHDPTRVTDGIELTEDPIIHARRGAYDVSVAGRTGGWQACPFAKIAG
jgi:catalase